MLKKFLPGKTVPEIFYNKVKENPSRKMFWTKREGHWTPKSAEEALDFCFQTIAGLKALGFRANDKICIFSGNREEWILTDYAAQWLGGATTAIYSTSSYEDILHILKSSGTKILFISGPEMLDRLGPIQDLPSLEYVVSWDFVDPTRVHSNHIQFLNRNDFLKNPISDDEATQLFKKIDEESMTILLYTSGTTGEPKGVCLTQENVVANLNQLLGSMPIAEMKRTMSFLPLSHIYERALHSTMIIGGVEIYFVEDMNKLPEYMIEARPDIMIGVPRVFEKMYVKIQEALRKAPPVKKSVAKIAFNISKLSVGYRIKGKSLPVPLWVLQEISNLVVFNKIKAITGGELKYFVSGGAPLSEQIARFFFQAGITILEGFGLSETMILGYNRPGRIRFGSVGEPLEDTYYKIAEDGEILVKGPQVMKEYFGLPEKTKETFTEDGWFKTGDIGELSKDNYLKITDRKKEIIITAGGKNVAPQPIENEIKQDPLIEQVCLIGDQRKYITALLVPNLELCESWAKHKGFSISGREECTRSAELKAAFQEKLDKVNSKLPRYEQIKYFAILPSAFSVDGGELTPTLKLKRRVIQEKYKEMIASLYPPSEESGESIG